MTHLITKFVLAAIIRGILYYKTGQRRVTLGWMEYVKRVAPPGNSEQSAENCVNLVYYSQIFCVLCFVSGKFCRNWLKISCNFLKTGLFFIPR